MAEAAVLVRDLRKAYGDTLAVDGVTNPEVWVNGQKLAKLANSFPAGTHTVVLRLDGAKLPDSVRLKSTDVSWNLN